MCVFVWKTTRKAEKLCKYLEEKSRMKNNFLCKARREEEDFYSIYLILMDVCDWDYYCELLMQYHI